MSAHPDLLVSNNVDLLLSGNYSDFTISCQNINFNVHRAILCPQSSYFRTLCAGDFKETRDRYSTIIDEEPSTITRMLLYMYAGGYAIPHLRPKLSDETINRLSNKWQHASGRGDNCSLEDELLTLDAKMYIAAGKYILEPMKDFASARYSARLRTSSTTASVQVPGFGNPWPEEMWGAQVFSTKKGKKRGSNLEADTVPRIDPTDFLSSVRTMYEKLPDTDRGLKECAVKFARTHPYVLQDRVVYESLVRDCPGFAFDLIEIKPPQAPSSNEEPSQVEVEYM